MGKKESIMKILEMLYTKSEIPSKEELGLDKESYGEILETMQHDELIVGANIIRGGRNSKVQSILTKHAKITIKGTSYLDQYKVDYHEIINEFINDLQGILNTNIPGVNRDTVDDIKADAHEALHNILIKNNLIEL